MASAQQQLCLPSAPGVLEVRPGLRLGLGLGRGAIRLMSGPDLGSRLIGVQIRNRVSTRVGFGIGVGFGDGVEFGVRIGMTKTFT